MTSLSKRGWRTTLIEGFMKQASPTKTEEVPKSANDSSDT